MVKNVYHVVTDLHDSDKNKNNRINYQAEIELVKDKLIDICYKYKQQGYNNYVLLLGDVFDRGYASPDASALGNNFWVALSEKISGIYSVVGNHELSFYKNNPFYTLMSSMDSKKLLVSNRRLCAPKGLMQVFHVTDRLEDGDVVFHFNHYGTPVSGAEDGKVNIGLYHQDLVCRDILDEMKKEYNASIFETMPPQDFGNLKIFRGMDYNFFGHMHKVYGCWELVDDDTKQKSVLWYLGSLGRPNVTEVNDSFLERDIPSVIVEDGKFCGVQSNKFNLLSREQCVLEDVVQKNSEKYQKNKMVQAEKVYVPTKDDPILELQERCGGNEVLSGILSDLLRTDIDKLGSSIRREVGALLNG